jgi:hypothetical protein
VAPAVLDEAEVAMEGDLGREFALMRKKNSVLYYKVGDFGIALRWLGCICYFAATVYFVCICDEPAGGTFEAF